MSFEHGGDKLGGAKNGKVVFRLGLENRRSSRSEKRTDSTLKENTILNSKSNEHASKPSDRSKQRESRRGGERRFRFGRERESQGWIFSGNIRAGPYQFAFYIFFNFFSVNTLLFNLKLKQH